MRSAAVLGVNVSAPQSGKRRWIRTALIGAALVAWQLYELASATEMPSRAVLTLHYIFLACGLLAVGGALVAYLQSE
jgi:uncharacterized protein involved in response to NO